VIDESTFSTVGAGLIEKLREVRLRCSCSGLKAGESGRVATARSELAFPE